MKNLYIFGSDKGGVGKTEQALQFIHALTSVGYSPAVGEADSVQRLGQVYDAVDVSLHVSDDVLQRMERPGAAEAFFNQLLGVVEDAEVAVIDLGASVSGQFVDWVGKNDITGLLRDEGWQMVFVSVSSPDSTAIAASVDFLGDAQAAAGDRAGYALVLNDLYGSGFGFVYSAGPVRDAIHALPKPITMIEVPHVRDIAVVSYSRRNGHSLAQAAAICREIQSHLEKGSTMPADLAEIAEEIGVTEQAGNVARKLLVRQQRRAVLQWLAECEEALTPLLPQAEPADADEQPEGADA